MPLPWKKTKVSRISRLVADFQSPPKRGGSLVVQTGFPTSLVDLFVKNRDRLKKHSKKKSQSEPPMEISRPMNVTPPPPCYTNMKVNSSSGSQENVRTNKIKRTPVEELAVVEQCVGDDRDFGVGGADADGSKKGRVVMAVLRVFLVVVLALSSKRLAVGITKSAFLLLFLEFVGTRVLVHLRPCSKARTVFDCFVERVKLWCFCKGKKDADVSSLEEIKRFEKDSTRGSGDGGACDSSIEEIEVVDPKCVVFTPEKEMDWSRGVCSSAVEDKVPEQRNCDKLEQDVEEDSSQSLSVKEEESCQGEEFFDESQAEAKMIVDESSVETKRKGNSAYLILCLIVLAGLVGGRVLALVLTVSWCLALKLVAKLRPATISC
ncbi:ethylene-regulated transcript 2 (ERT2) [Citrus sinensis]|uniref:Ethylene-regulated transcript 2 (ERT2) n=1 Tax=Citrus sinensis TaxID=2711 RepID=A0ACB8NEJ9_CITSI|nr:ethylene-regulated transcript 2 (ERT2) [Citrus sinensis]